MTHWHLLRRTKRFTVPILIVLMTSLAFAATGCGGRDPAAWTMEGIAKGPFWVAVNEARDYPDGGGGQAGPELLVSSGDNVLVGQGTIFVNLQLYRGADFQALKPYIEATPGAEFNYADFADGLRVQVYWPASDAQSAGKMTFRLRKGAPLGNETALQEDIRLTVQRRPEPHFTAAVEGNSAVKTPYEKYLLPGTDGAYGQYRNSYGLAPGTYTFRLSFTKATNRKTVEEAVTRALRGATFRWQGAKQVLVTATLTGPGYYVVSATGSFDREGMPVWLNDELVISVSQPLRIVSIPVGNTAPGEARTIATLLPGQKPQSVSGDGQRVIALEDPWGQQEPGDGPLAQNPWLYRAGAAPAELTRQCGRVFRAGFGAGERIWILRNGIFYQEYDYAGQATAKVDSDQISGRKYPPGWTISADGRTAVALVRPADQQEQQPTAKPVSLDLLIADTASGETRRIPAFTSMPENRDFLGGMVVAMALSRDGSTLVYADPSTTTPRLTAVDLASGPSRPIMPVAASSPVVLSPGADMALCKDSSGQWVMVTLADGVARALTISPTHAGWAGSVAEPGFPGFSPDGRYLAYTAPSADGSEHAWVYDVATGQAADFGAGTFAGWSDDGGSVFVARP